MSGVRDRHRRRLAEPSSRPGEQARLSAIQEALRVLAAGRTGRFRRHCLHHRHRRPGRNGRHDRDAYGEGLPRPCRTSCWYGRGSYSSSPSTAVLTSSSPSSGWLPTPSFMTAAGRRRSTRRPMGELMTTGARGQSCCRKNRFRDALVVPLASGPVGLRARTCLECGDPFRTMRSSRLHCSRGCQRAAQSASHDRRSLARVMTTRRVDTPEIGGTLL